MQQEKIIDYFKLRSRYSLKEIGKVAVRRGEYPPPDSFEYHKYRCLLTADSLCGRTFLNYVISFFSLFQIPG
jgi:hypothetical protein